MYYWYTVLVWLEQVFTKEKLAVSTHVLNSAAERVSQALFEALFAQACIYRKKEKTQLDARRVRVRPIRRAAVRANFATHNTTESKSHSVRRRTEVGELHVALAIQQNLQVESKGMRQMQRNAQRSAMGRSERLAGLQAAGRACRVRAGGWRRGGEGRRLGSKVAPAALALMLMFSAGVIDRAVAAHIIDERRVQCE